MSRRLHQQLVLARIVTARLLDVDVLPGVQPQQRHGDVPVIRRRDADRVDALVIEDAAEVALDLRCPRLALGALEPLVNDVRIDIADVRDLGVRQPGEVLRVDGATSVDADDGDPYGLIRGAPSAKQQRAEPGGGGLFHEVPSIYAHVYSL